MIGLGWFVKSKAGKWTRGIHMYQLWTEWMELFPTCGNNFHFWRVVISVPQHPMISTRFAIFHCFTLLCHIMSSSASTESTGESLVIRVSSTMCQQYDPAFPNCIYGDCYPIDYVVVAPGVWLCVGFSDKAPGEELFDGWVWVHGRDLCWFSPGSSLLQLERMWWCCRLQFLAISS